MKTKADVIWSYLFVRLSVFFLCLFVSYCLIFILNLACVCPNPTNYCKFAVYLLIYLYLFDKTLYVRRNWDGKLWFSRWICAIAALWTLLTTKLLKLHPISARDSFFSVQESKSLLVGAHYIEMWVNGIVDVMYMWCLNNPQSHFETKEKKML